MDPPTSIIRGIIAEHAEFDCHLVLMHEHEAWHIDCLFCEVRIVSIPDDGPEVEVNEPPPDDTGGVSR